MSLMWSVGLTILSVLESATNGWGVGGRMFTAVYFGGGAVPVPAIFVVFFCITLFSYFVGAAGATVWVRWRAIGLTVFFMVIGAVLVGAIALLTFTDNWPSVGRFLDQNQAFGIALWLLVPTVLAAIAGYLVLRRATPHS
jgi:hypothetical protein